MDHLQRAQAGIGDPHAIAGCSRSPSTARFSACRRRSGWSPDRPRSAKQGASPWSSQEFPRSWVRACHAALLGLSSRPVLLLVIGAVATTLADICHRRSEGKPDRAGDGKCITAAPRMPYTGGESQIRVRTVRNGKDERERLLIALGREAEELHLPRAMAQNARACSPSAWTPRPAFTFLTLAASAKAARWAASTPGGHHGPKSSRKRSIWCMRSCSTVTIPMSPLPSRFQ